MIRQIQLILVLVAFILAPCGGSLEPRPLLGQILSAGYDSYVNVQGYVQDRRTLDTTPRLHATGVTVHRAYGRDYILTAKHLTIPGGDVKLSGGQDWILKVRRIRGEKAEWIRAQVEVNLDQLDASLISATADETKAIARVSRRLPRPGETVLILGAPDFRPIALWGKVTRFDSSLEDSRGRPHSHFVVGVGTWGGFSGSGVFDENGGLIGLHIAGRTLKNGTEEAIAISMREIKEQIEILRDL